jgi:copper transport protein
VDALRVGVRAARDLALLVAAGGALFVLLVAPFPGERRLLATSGGAAAMLAAAGTGLQGMALIGGDLFAPEPWCIALASSHGVSARVLVAASASIAVAAAMPRRAPRALLLAAGALGIAAGLPLTGHAASASPAPLAGAVLGLHAFAAAFWVGSLVALHALLRDPASEAASALHRFSRIAMVAVVVLIAAGIGFAATQLDSVAAVTGTPYGNLLLGKLALLALLVAVAARNRFVLLPALDRTRPGAAPVLRRAVVAEIALAALVLAVTAVLVHTPPRSGALVTTLSSATLTARVTVTPGRAGHNAIAVEFRDEQGRITDPAEVVVEISNPAAGIERIARTLVRRGAGSYRHEGGELAFAGTWRIEIRARIGDFEQVDLVTNVRMP